MRLLETSRASVMVVVALFSLLLGQPVWSQPPIAVKIIVPSTPGGGSDIVARLMADHISRAQGSTIVVENRPGAGNTIGTEAAARAAPDGSTLLMNTPEFVINPHLRKVNYDPLSSFEPICYLVRSPQLLVVNGAAPYRTLAELFDAARARPGELTLASAGPASSPHIAFETIKRAANVNMIYVPYPGSGPAVNALLGQHVTAVMATYPNLVEQVRTGKLRALVTPSQSRIADMPDVPTVGESGLKDLDADLWFGVFTPAKTQPRTISQFVDWFTSALKAPEIRSKLAVQGLFPVGSCGSEFGDFIRLQYEESGRAIREANIKAQ